MLRVARVAPVSKIVTSRCKLGTQPTFKWTLLMFDYADLVKLAGRAPNVQPVLIILF